MNRAEVKERCIVALQVAHGKTYAEAERAVNSLSDRDLSRLHDTPACAVALQVADLNCRIADLQFRLAMAKAELAKLL